MSHDGFLVAELAVLRRDGFASMDAGDGKGALTTRPISFKGKYLFVNMDAPTANCWWRFWTKKAR